MRTGWDLCLDGPFRAPDMAVNTAVPAPATTVTLLGPWSHLPVFPFASAFLDSLCEGHRADIGEQTSNINCSFQGALLTHCELQHDGKSSPAWPTGVG